MIAKAKQDNINLSPSKAKLVCNLVRGKKVDEAIGILKHQPQKCSAFLLKLLTSAVSNAINNHAMLAKDLYIFSVVANKGRTQKRTMIRARGRSDLMRKRHTNLVIELSNDVAEQENRAYLLKPRAHQYKYRKLETVKVAIKKKIHTERNPE